LTQKASRGDQIKNAASFESRGLSKVLFEEHMTPETLADSIDLLYNEREKYIENMEKQAVSNGINPILTVLSAK
jgi:UDP-N-acetylglucosamine--N-acetylmuramyl-(pentapeptide) pyrophosphoryl-undecaprenol N-acetylglucosamine transferase